MIERFNRIFRFRKMDEIIQRSDLPNDVRLLDAEGGTGYITVGQVVVADVLQGMLSQAKSKDLSDVNPLTKTHPCREFCQDTADGRASLKIGWPTGGGRRTVACIDAGWAFLIVEPDIRRWFII